MGKNRAKSKKYTSRVTQGDAGWLAEIVRRMTAKKSIVTKSKAGFSSEAEAQTWVEAELKAFLVRLSEQSKQRSDDYTAGLNYDNL